MGAWAIEWPSLVKIKMIEFSSADGKFQLQVPANELRSLLSFCQSAKKDETGGILVGKYVDDRRIAKITYVSPAPNDSKKGATWFVRGLRGLQELVDRFWISGRGYYIGEWHFHPYSSARPSGQDLQQMRAICKNKDYNCSEPLLVIVGGDPLNTWEITATVVLASGKTFPLSRI